MNAWRWIVILLLLYAAGGCGGADSVSSDAGAGTKEVRANNDGSEIPNHHIREWVEVEHMPAEIAVFDTVFWEPDDTTSLRELIYNTPLVQDKTILEIGTGSGLVSLCCLDAGAAQVVATDVNRAAIDNARFNAMGLDLSGKLKTRLVPLDDPSAFRVIDDDERFDLIISNPPWEDGVPQSIDEYALYDRNFALLHSLLKDAKNHLYGDGKLLLAYGCVDAIRQVQKLGDAYDYDVRILDDRELDSLEPVFLPGMLLELTPRAARR